MSLLTFLETAGETVVNTANEVAGKAAEAAADVANKVTENSADVADAMNEAAAQAPQQGSGWTMWIMLGLIFVVMYFFMIRPQKKQQKEMQRFRDSLAKGDKVVTIGGIFGTVTEIKDDSVLIEVDNGVKIRVSKQALVKDFTDPTRQ